MMMYSAVLCPFLSRPRLKNLSNSLTSLHGTGRPTTESTYQQKYPIASCIAFNAAITAIITQNTIIAYSAVLCPPLSIIGVLRIFLSHTIPSFYPVSRGELSGIHGHVDEKTGRFATDPLILVYNGVCGPPDRKGDGMRVAILMGSQSDWDVMRSAKDTLDQFGIDSEVRVMSAHRSPGVVADFASGAHEAGFGVIIAAAGGAAHLAGSIAAHTTLPVIGVPMAGGSLGGKDALLATVQMPSGVPVATVAIGKAGATNSAILAAQILALADNGLKAKLADHKKTLAEKVEKMDADVRKETGA